MDQTLIDTLRVFSPDSLTNTKIYYYETIRLIENNGNWVSIYVPIFIAFLALAFSIWQFYFARKDRIFNSTPLLYFSDYYPTNGIALELRNKGLGVAIINDIFYNYNGECFRNIFEVITKIVDFDAMNKGYFLDTNNGFVFEVEEEIYLEQNGKLPLFDLRLMQNDFVEKLYKELQNTEVVVDYTNAYRSIKRNRTKKLNYLLKAEESIYNIIKNRIENSEL